MRYLNKNIKWLLILYIILTLLLGWSIQFINKKYQVKKKNIDELSIKNKTLLDLIIDSKTTADEFVLQDKYDDNFIQTGQDILANNFYNVVGDSRDIIATLKKIKKFNSTDQKSDTLLLLLEDYENTFRELNLSIRESGNNNLGLCGKIYKLSWEISDSVSKYPLLSKPMVHIKAFEEQYIANPTIKSFTNLSSSIAELINNCYLIDDISFNQVYTLKNLTSYQTYLKDLHSVNLRIGIIQRNTGYINDLNEKFNNYKNSLLTLKADVAPIINRMYANIKIIYILLLVAIGCLFLLLSYRLYTYIYKNFNSLRKAALGLKSGNPVSDELIEDTSFEFKTIAEILKSFSLSYQQKKNFVAELLEDKFDTEFANQDQEDAFMQLIIDLRDKLQTNKEEQVKHTEENDLRRFINEGIAKFSDILRENTSSLEDLTYEFIKNAVIYLDAIQGGLFLVSDDDENFLDLKASFAYNRKRYINKKIKKGDGLVGAAALELKTIHLSDIPTDYIEITSGLGDAPPDKILIVPCVYDGVLEGVLEIASLNDFNQNQIELIQQVASSLASTLISTKTSERTNSLLKKSQEQAAEMAEQEEEMRQNMEELKATQEESTRREEELSRFINAVNNSFFVVHYNNEGIITQLNERMIRFLRIGDSEMLGKTHQDLIKEDTVITNDLIKSVIEAGQINTTETFDFRDVKYQLHYHLSPNTFDTGFAEGVINIISYQEID